MLDSDNLEQQLALETAARKSAETCLEQKSAEIQELQSRLSYRTDIIAQKTASLRQVQAELDQLRLRLILSEKMAAVGQLAAGVAEEIQKPLNFMAESLRQLHDHLNDLGLIIAQQEQCIKTSGGITLFRSAQAVELKKLNRLKKQLRADFVAVDASKLVDEFLESTNRAQRMVTDLWEFSRADQAPQVEENINELLDRSVSLASYELRHRAVIVKQYGPIPNILCDSGRLVHAFLSILLNAAEAIDSKGTITLRTGVHSSMLWVDIADTGRGIAEQDLGKIFDPFFTTKSAGQGSGLGLHQVRGAVEAHEGRTSLMSRLGQGTTFRIMLPINRYEELAAL
jgi:two-component system NtrC family sensor kinase